MTYQFNPDIKRKAVSNLAPRAKVDKAQEASVAVAEDFDLEAELDDAPFDLGDLDLNDLPSLETEITEEDLLNAAAKMGDSVDLDLEIPDEKPSVNDLALQLLQKEVRDTQVMVTKFGHELEEFRKFLKDVLFDMDQSTHRALSELGNRLTVGLSALQEQKPQVSVTPAVAPKEEPEEPTAGLTDGQKQKILDWMSRQEKLPSAAVTAQGLGQKLGIPGGVILGFFREQKLTGKGGSLKKPE